MNYRSLFLGATLGCATSLNAQTPQARFELEEVVVRAEPAPSLTVPPLAEVRAEIAQTPGGAEVIDSETYRKGRAGTLADALQMAPGVYVQPRFGAEEARLSIRGSGIQRTFHGRGIQLLQDGVPINLADGGFDFQSIEPLAARYIEVFRGANALEYGATTLGGAINFISQTGHTAPPLGLRFSAGSFGTIHAQAASGLVHGPLDVYLSLSHFSMDGFREHSQQNSQRLFFNLGYRITPELETRFYFTWLQTDSELPGNLTKEQLEADPRQPARSLTKMFDVVDSNWKRDYSLFRLANKTTWQRDDHRLTLSTFWTQKDLDHPILYVIDQYSNDFGLNLRYDYTGDLFGQKNRFTLGFLPTYGVIQDNRYANDLGNRGLKIADNEQIATNLNFYVEDTFYFLPKAAVVLGTQVTWAERRNRDHFPATLANPDNSDVQEWWGFSPKLGLLWEITQEAQAFINISRSFEPPSFGELTATAGGLPGLVDLRAQTATTLEIGTRGKAGRFQWDLAWYHAWIDHELMEYEVLPGLTQTVNAGRTIHQGVEAALDITLFDGLLERDKEAKRDRIAYRQVYLWNGFRFDNDAVYGNNELPGIPEHYTRAELMYEHPSGFYAGPNVEWSATKTPVDSANTLYADPYALLGFKIGYRSERGFSVFVEAKNLTDKRYAATTGVISQATPFNGNQFLPGDGRGLYGGIEWRW